MSDNPVNSSVNEIPYECPYCDTAKIETTATAPYVRGFILAYVLGYKSYIGCASCVRKKVLGEAGLSALVGWFSITSLIINPFLIIYNLIQGLLVRATPEKAARKLKKMGIPLNRETLTTNQIGYILAANMIAADGKVDPKEVRVAEEMGEKIFEDFDEASLHILLAEPERMPPVGEVAKLLKNQISEDAKKQIFNYLTAIAYADGHVAAEEKAMLAQVAQAIELDLNSLRNDQGGGSPAG